VRRDCRRRRRLLRTCLTIRDSSSRTKTCGRPVDDTFAAHHHQKPLRRPRRIQEWQIRVARASESDPQSASASEARPVPGLRYPHVCFRAVRGIISPMTAPRVRVDYEALGSITQQLRREADGTQQMLAGLQRCLYVLKGGGWVGSRPGRGTWNIAHGKDVIGSGAADRAVPRRDRTRPSLECLSMERKKPSLNSPVAALALTRAASSHSPSPRCCSGCSSPRAA